MNILLWTLQVLLALHTAVGAIWKFSHSAEQTMPSLKAIPPALWLGLSGIELVCALALVLPALLKSLGSAPPVAAVCIAIEMLLFTGVHLAAGDPNRGPIVYWLIVAAVSAFVAYGRFALAPL